MTAVFLAGFDYSLEVAPDRTHEPADWLAGVARLGLPLERPLAGWRDAIARNPFSRLSLFVTQWADAITDGSSAPPYWRDVDATLVVEVRSWLFSDATRAQLQQRAGERQIDEALAALRGPDRFRAALIAPAPSEHLTEIASIGAAAQCHAKERAHG